MLPLIPSEPHAAPCAVAIGASAGGVKAVWSAGCSTGEETYSAAIMIADAFGARAADLDVKIYATGIDDDALMTARQAVFRPRISSRMSRPTCWSATSRRRGTSSVSAASSDDGASLVGTISRRTRHCRRST